MHHVEPETLKQAEAPTEPGSLREPEILIKEPGKSGEPKKLTDSSATKQQPQESQRLGTELQIQTEEPESMEPEPSANNMESMEPKQDSRLISAAKRFVVDDRFHEIGSAASSSQRGFLPWWPAASIRRRRPGPMPAPTDPEWAKRRALVKRRFVVRAPFASRNRNELAAEGDEEPEVAERRAMLQQRLARLYRHMFSKGSAKRDLESAHRGA
jgi:hypothetical protein